MSKVDPVIRQAWLEQPEQPVDLIVHFEGEMGTVSAALSDCGVQVKRRFQLTHTLSVRCSSKVALDLLDQSWVTRIEADRAVRALRR